MLFGKKEIKLKEEVSELKKEVELLKTILLKSSMGNKGVQTDSQQTSDKQQLDALATTFGRKEKDLGTTNEAIEVVNLMNDFKESLKRKFKSLTSQEFFVFSLIYVLDEQLGAVSYKDIALKAGLTESVIRDYVRHLFSKGIPILKERKNNKLVLLRIAPELKSIVTLDSLIAIHNPYSEKRVIAENSEAMKVIKEL